MFPFNIVNFLNKYLSWFLDSGKCRLGYYSLDIFPKRCISTVLYMLLTNSFDSDQSQKRVCICGDLLANIFSSKGWHCVNQICWQLLLWKVCFVGIRFTVVESLVYPCWRIFLQRKFSVSWNLLCVVLWGWSVPLAQSWKEWQLVSQICLLFQSFLAIHL